MNTASSGSISILFELARPRQWVKNLFVLAPIFFAGEFLNPGLFIANLAAAVLFCLLASSVYILNDILDLERDRVHPDKCRRPLPSGRISIQTAWLQAAVMGAVALVGGVLLGGSLVLVMAIYYAVNLAYSLKLKQVAIIDAFCISSGFILRVWAGAAVSGLYISHWLLICTMTLSLFLAFGKRRQEMIRLGENGRDHRPSLDGYSIAFLNHAVSMLLTITLICYILYVADPSTVSFFNTRAVMATSVFVLYGVLRYLNLIQTHCSEGDPTHLLFTDRPLQLTCLGWSLTWAVIIYFR